MRFFHFPARDNAFNVVLFWGLKIWIDPHLLQPHHGPPVMYLVVSVFVHAPAETIIIYRFYSEASLVYYVTAAIDRGYDDFAVFVL